MTYVHDPLVGVLHHLFGMALFEDTAGEGSQALCRFGILSASAIVDNADLRALFVWIPHALGQLKMSDKGAIAVALN
jgi:hypothetical protein